MSRSRVSLLSRSVLMTLVLVSIVFVATGVSAVSEVSPQSAAASLQSAPVNPLFTSYTQAMAAGQNSATVTIDGHKLGLTPHPVSDIAVHDLEISLSKSGTESFTAAGTAPLSTYPTSYDLRTVGKVSPVKDQNGWGTCWAHATYGSLESSFMPTATYDFSEKNLANFHGFSIPAADGGGNAYMSAATLTRWDGPVYETSDPYPWKYWTTSPTFASQKHVQNVWFLPAHTARGLSATSTVKYYLQTYGAVYTSFYWSDSYYNASSRSYYEPAGAADSGGGGHAVTIIGWNDNYAKTNFKTVPAGNGAWLVKNSWGTGWGNAGYFWVSYYDKWFTSAIVSGAYRETAVFRGESTSNYGRVYSYDKLGFVNVYTWTAYPKNGTFANTFTTLNAATLKAVGFYTADFNVPVTIKVYRLSSTATNPTSGTLVSSKTVTLAKKGYNTVNLTTQPALAAHQRFSVVVSVKNPTYDYWLPVEENAYGYSANVVSYPGEGYMKEGGTSTTWYDLTTLLPNRNIALKAYTT